MIKLPSSVKNLNILGTQGNQPQTFYLTTASGQGVLDPLGLNGLTVFGGYGQALDTNVYVAATSYVSVSGCLLTLNTDRAIIAQVSWGGDFYNNGLGSGDGTLVGLFTGGSLSVAGYCTGYEATGGGITEVKQHFHRSLLYNVGAGATTFDVRFCSTGTNGKALKGSELAYLTILPLGNL